MADRLVMTAMVDGAAVEVFQRTAAVPNPAIGMIPMQTPVEVVYVMPAPEWPKVRIRARRRLARLRYRLGRRPGIMLDDERFNAAFRVDCADGDFACLLLNPALQAFVLEKTTVDWSAGGGAIKLFYRGQLRRKRAAASLARLARFRALIDAELFAFDGAPG